MLNTIDNLRDACRNFDNLDDYLTSFISVNKTSDFGDSSGSYTCTVTKYNNSTNLNHKLFKKFLKPL